MNLYDALFVKRPVVEPELFASLRPVTYSGGLMGGLGGFAGSGGVPEDMPAEAADESDGLRSKDRRRTGPRGKRPARHGKTRRLPAGHWGLANREFQGRRCSRNWGRT